MNHYEILEVSQNASKEVIKAAYRSLIQRYHPDKNPDNPTVADRASLVVQAYEVLSDTVRRTAYDIELKEQAARQANALQYDRRRAQARFASNSPTSDADNKVFWYLCLLIALILVSGWLIVSLSGKKRSSESDLSELRPSAKVSQPAQMDGDAGISRAGDSEIGVSEFPSREIPAFLSDLSVNLRVPDKPLEDSVRVLSIPTMGLKVGTFDAESAIRHLQNSRELIDRKLIEKLAYAKYDELIKPDREQYLTTLILDSIGETTGTDRYQTYSPSADGSPGRYGVIEISLPESFSVR